MIFRIHDRESALEDEGFLLSQNLVKPQQFHFSYFSFYKYCFEYRTSLPATHKLAHRHAGINDF